MRERRPERCHVITMHRSVSSSNRMTSVGPSRVESRELGIRASDNACTIISARNVRVECNRRQPKNATTTTPTIIWKYRGLSL